MIFLYVLVQPPEEAAAVYPTRSLGGRGTISVQEYGSFLYRFRNNDDELDPQGASISRSNSSCRSSEPQRSRTSDIKWQCEQKISIDDR
jgi:hypothetical protein